MPAPKGRQALLDRARLEVVRLSGGRAEEWNCEACGGMGDESVHACAECRTGNYRHRPCFHCNGFGIYWRIRGTAVVYTVAEVLERPDLEGRALHQH